MSFILNPHRFSSADFYTENLELWFDASDASTLFDSTVGGSTPADGADVKRWEDKSGNGNHATQDTANNCPHRSVSEENSLDCIEFDGNDWFDLESNVDLPDNYTLFFVFRRPSGSVNSVPLGGITTSSRSYPFLWHSTGGIYATIPANGSYIQTGANNSTGFFLGGVRYNGSVEDITDLDLNGVSQTFTYGGTGSTAAMTRVGARGSSYHSGNICEILLYNSFLSGTNYGSVETFLANKWGITI